LGNKGPKGATEADAPFSSEADPNAATIVAATRTRLAPMANKAPNITHLKQGKLVPTLSLSESNGHALRQ